MRTAASTYLDQLRQLEFVGPVAIMLTILNAKGSYLHSGSMSHFNVRPLSLEAIPTPEVLVQEESELDNRLTELFEIVWNAYGSVRRKDFKPS